MCPFLPVGMLCVMRGGVVRVMCWVCVPCAVSVPRVMLPHQASGVVVSHVSTPTPWSMNT